MQGKLWRTLTLATTLSRRERAEKKRALRGAVRDIDKASGPHS